MWIEDLFLVFITGTSSGHLVDKFRSVALGVCLLDSSEVTLLGSPITVDALPLSFESKLSNIQTLISCLETLLAHDAFYLLCHCFAIPKLLVTAYFSILEGFWKFDNLICTFLQTVTNINISSSAWAQSVLPAAKGGLGIYSAVDLSLPSFLSSLHMRSSIFFLIGFWHLCWILLPSWGSRPVVRWVSYAPWGP